METINQLVRTTLELEQFECEMCGRMVYINKMDLEVLRQKDKVIIPDCPFNCWSETKHRRTIRIEVREVKDTRNIKDLSEYAEKDTMKHAYEMGFSNGGQWIHFQDYQHKVSCRWEYVTGRGVNNGVDVFLKRYKDTMNVDRTALIEAIEKGLEGFKIVPDEIGTDAPLLMYNENDIGYKGFDFRAEVEAEGKDG